MTPSKMKIIFFSWNGTPLQYAVDLSEAVIKQCIKYSKMYNNV